MNYEIILLLKGEKEHLPKEVVVVAAEDEARRLVELIHNDRSWPTFVAVKGIDGTIVATDYGQIVHILVRPLAAAPVAANDNATFGGPTAEDWAAAEAS